MCTNGHAQHGKDYAKSIVEMQERLNFRTLLNMTADQSTYHARRPSGLLTLGVRTHELSNRHLLGLQGFRLAQYLQLGWVCEELVADRAMFCEPIAAHSSDDLHVVTVSPEGVILGYLGLVGTGDMESQRVDDPERMLFPVEKAHAVNVSNLLPPTTKLTTDQILELKRFVHRRTLNDRVLRLCVTLELILAAGCIMRGLATRLMIGDVEELGALRHLTMVGLTVSLVDGTEPHLSSEHHLHPAYTKRVNVKPFMAEVPSDDEVDQRLRRLSHILASANPFASARELVAEHGGTIRRIPA